MDIVSRTGRQRVDPPLSLALPISYTHTHTMANRPVNVTLNRLTWCRNRDPYSNQLAGRLPFPE